MAHEGSDWIRRAFSGVQLSPLGEAVADLLWDAFAGIYHIDNKALRRVEWTNPHYIRVYIAHELATFDANELTRLVFLAHDYCLRMEVGPAGCGLELVFHRRRREGGIAQRHPTLEQAVKQWRESLHETKEAG